MPQRPDGVWDAVTPQELYDLCVDTMARKDSVLSNRGYPICAELKDGKLVLSECGDKQHKTLTIPMDEWFTFIGAVMFILETANLTDAGPVDAPYQSDAMRSAEAIVRSFIGSSHAAHQPSQDNPGNPKE